VRKQLVVIPSSQMISLSSDSYSKVLAENKLSLNQQYVNSVKGVGERLTRAVELYLEQNGMSAYTKGYDYQPGISRF
jgi:hypothetical protein